MLKIKRITIPDTPVYDLTVDQNSNFYANDILVHNCQEITLPSEPIEDIDSTDGVISLCTLAALNWGKPKSPHDFAKPADLLVRFLDEILDYQDYPVAAAKKATDLYRPLGIGIINLAYFLARNGVRYDDSALPIVDEYMEAMSYYLTKASADLAIEKGACLGLDNTRYSQGVVPIDTRKREIDELVPHQERFDWDGLREQLRQTGIRNATLMALMPAECQHWENKLALADGRELNFHELLTEQGVDWEAIEQMGIPQRYAFDRPLEIKTRTGTDIATEYYYNGVQPVIRLVFDDQEYSFTLNHKLLVLRDGAEVWVEVRDIVITDRVITQSGTTEITAIEPNGQAHTWDISTIHEEYILPNGVVSHNTSAQISNSTNGIEPVRALVTEKVSKTGVLRQVVPEITKYRNRYDMLWDQPSPTGYLKVCAVLTKYLDQSASVNTSINPQNFPDGKVSMKSMLDDLLFCYRYGIKNGYYNNTFDGSADSQVDRDAAAISETTPTDQPEDDAGCDSCIL